MSWNPPLDPNGTWGEDIQPETGQALIDLVAFYKRTADANGEPYDPEWDRWLEEDAAGGVVEA